MKYRKLQITSEDICKGIRGSLSECAIAQAFIRHGVNHPMIGDDGIWFLENGYDKMKYRSSEQMRDFIVRFDRDEDVEPITLELKEVE